MLKLAWRNIVAKPGRSVAIVFAIAISVAMIFAMLSFKPTVHDYIYDTETAVSGMSDIKISTKSSSESRITEIAAPLSAIDGIENVVPSLTLYALVNGEYIQLRGFDTNSLCKLQNINVVDGSIDQIDAGSATDGHTDGIVISKRAAKHFRLGVRDRVVLSVGSVQTNFYIEAIADNDGYFLEDAPYQFIGNIYGVSRMILSNIQAHICNEIYIKVADGADVDAVIDSISAIDAYSTMLVERTGDEAYIDAQTTSLTAPVVLAGAAVLVLSVAIIFLLFMMSENEKLALISKLGVIGATREQIFAMFVSESAILAIFGCLIGAGLAIGTFALIVKLTLSSVIALRFSAWRLSVAILLGFVSALISSVAPIARSFKGSIRENMLGAKRVGKLAMPITLVPAIVLLAVTESGVLSAPIRAVLSVVTLAMLFLALGCLLPVALRFVAKLASKAGPSTVRVAGLAVARQRRHSRSATIFGVGMAISMLLFMAWSMTTSIFDSYVSDFRNIAFVSNVQASVDVSQFEQLDGVSSATKIVWQQGTLGSENFSETINLLGSKHSADFIDFRYITSKQRVEELLLSDKPYIFVDYSLKELYGVDEGSMLDLTLDGVTKRMEVGGILRHELFNGAYVVVSEKALEDLYGILPNTVIITSDNISEAVNAIRERYADNNYYAVEALTAYRWEMESTTSIFDLVGTLAFAVALFVMAVTIAASIVGRSSEEKHRTALLNAGMSKKKLLSEEIIEYVLTAAVCFILSLVFSVAVTSCLIHALNLFGLYFEFMYEAWVVIAVGASLSICYIAVPLVFNFKKGYTVKRI